MVVSVKPIDDRNELKDTSYLDLKQNEPDDARKRKWKQKRNRFGRMFEVTL